MELRLRVSEANVDDLASLYRWLRDDPDVAQEAELSLGTAENQPGAMGWSLELINALIATAFSGASTVVASIALWQQNRSTPSTVRIERGNNTVEVSAPDLPEARRLAEELLAEGERSETSGDCTPSDAP
ncbi:hypothetical protein WKI65_32605 [Streptomyces sp. MS1.AVA.3]|uniref:effector-associated constant component EACC1 n=1 Tax=Streptomyces decoyicus TaxID=249567 RepID=UPI0030C3B404